MEILKHYFPKLQDQQLAQLEKLPELYKDWNMKINLISRKDMDHFVLHHLLHSLSIAHFFDFNEGTQILDLGCGGGFPGIPLAIFFPQVHFLLLDSIGKKIQVVQDVIQKLGLNNATGLQKRVENVNQKFDFVVTRAVASMPTLIDWTQKSFLKEQKNKQKNGLIALKGGDLSQELAAANCQVWALGTVFDEAYFQEKKLVYCPFIF